MRISRAACDNEPVRAMPSSNSTLPTPTEQRLPKSTRNRTLSAAAMPVSPPSKLARGGRSDREQNTILRGPTQLKNKGLRGGQGKYHDFMRRAALVLSL